DWDTMEARPRPARPGAADRRQFGTGSGRGSTSEPKNRVRCHLIPRSELMKVLRQPRRAQRGAALVEYGLIVAGVALVAAAAVSIFGHKTASIIGATAAILPGAQLEDNGTIAAGRIVDTVNNNGVI